MPRKLPATRKVPNKPALKKKLPVSVALPVEPEPKDPFGVVEPLTQQILQHHRASNSASVQARAAQGALLMEARASIPHGAWGTYIKQKLPYSRGTVDRAIDFHHFRNNHPALFDELRPVGLTIAHFLLERPVAELAAFLSSAHFVPSADATKTPSSMSLAEVMEVILGAPETEDLGEHILSRSRRAGRRAIAEIQALIDNRDAFDPDDVADLYDDLLHAVVELGVSYGLETT